MKKVIYTMSIFLILIFSFSSGNFAYAVNGADKYVGRYTELKPDRIISRSKRSFVKAVEIREKEDIRELENMLKNGEVSFTKAGDTVYVINIRNNINAARVKHRDDKYASWTEISALGYTDTSER